MVYRLYVDTSVFGALLDRELPDRVRLTLDVLRRLRGHGYEAFIGSPVLEEVRSAPTIVRETLERAVRDLRPPLIEETAAARLLAQAYLNAGLVPLKRKRDARHIAIATVAD